MSTLVKGFAALVLSMSCSVALAAEAAAAMEPTMDTACATEMKTANCAMDKTGEESKKCLHDYKKAHKDFKMSEECHKAMKHMEKPASK
jgi:hypothetical protein